MTESKTPKPKGRRKGQNDRICGAVRADGINLCTKPPGWGTDHVGFGRCRNHGGMQPSHQKAAAVKEARRMRYEFGAADNSNYMIDPSDALRQELTRTNGMIDWARGMCQGIIEAIEANAKAPTHKQNEKLPTDPLDVIEDNRFSQYNAILGEERDRLIRIARSSLDSNIQARKQALAEALASVVIECFHSMTRAIPDLTPFQLAAAQEALKTELVTATEQLLLTAGAGESTIPTSPAVKKRQLDHRRANAKSKVPPVPPPAS
jgi:hypothetical protein